MESIDVSICIVSYQARQYLQDCLNSLQAHLGELRAEIIVVDNGSSDGTAEMLRANFPQVRLVANPSNLGYTRPMNQALRLGGGRYLVQLNPDTLVHGQAFESLVDFMDQHPKAGIGGPKVLNRDGSLQKPCRRGEPRPWAVISYFSGLARLFPKSKWFGQYLVTYLPEDETHAVDGVSGSCMIIRREVVEQIGYLDEDFYAYQEDADLCIRARQAGWQVYYIPAAQITHYGGEGGSRIHPYRSILEWHKSYWLYYRKHLAKDYFILFNWLYYLAMAVKLGAAMLANMLRRGKFSRPVSQM